MTGETWEAVVGAGALAAVQPIPGVDAVVDAIVAITVVVAATGSLSGDSVRGAHAKSDEKTSATATTTPCSDCDPPDEPDNPKKKREISRQKQDGHIKGTPQNENRVRQGKPTSTFDASKDEADQLTQEAAEKGNPVPGRPGVKDWNAGRRIGTGPNGGGQDVVRVHEDSLGRIHGHPAGPEN
ncbi:MULTISPECIES: hypothetical protein [Acidiphilium]|uniref:hypothetical protein n=1 Tax=Acidiphilium TaxID=522 RepID=UPI00111598D4|nr:MULTISPECIES: hypothetical protein [Acidiphilium]